jgi:hypothetical protein
LSLPLVKCDIDIIPKHINIQVVEDNIEMGDMRG